jgi:hypothetical protein
MSDTPKDAKGIFLAALDIGDAAERAAFLERSCDGDPALRQRVDDLLRAYGQPDGPLDKLAAALAPTQLGEPIREQAGTMIGRYKLIELIGEGAMGSVWMAQQTEPVKRLVAIKLIKAGADCRTVLARFEAERQALALMDSPNIAKVLDGGASDSGTPYFAMELVKGVPITRFCDERQLTPRERLALFVPVCQAVQHAHQKGIIHRDLKPTNVLVAQYDGRPVPKVIDFGVAKAVGQPLTEKTLVTGFGAIIGTPAYMSPEQAELNQLDIDTRSDIYALGVLLYEILTGSTPFSREELERAGLLEILRVIREQDPPRPSTKLSTAGALPTIAANRGTEPKTLTGILRSELDWIVMKALEKDRNRRYETANSFAADIERYLAGEVVQAHPPTAAYRLRKFARKHRAPVIGLAAVAAALVVGMAGTTWGLLRARQAEQAAKTAERAAIDSEQKAVDAFLQATKDRDAKQEALNAEAEQRDRAERTLATGLLRPIGFSAAGIDPTEQRSFVDWSAIKESQLKMRVLEIALENPDSALRVARRAERAIQACVGLSPKRRARAINLVSAKQRDMAADPRIRAAACWLAIELGSADLPAWADSCSCLSEAKNKSSERFGEFVSFAVSRSDAQQIAQLNLNPLIAILATSTNDDVRKSWFGVLPALAPRLEPPQTKRMGDVVIRLLEDSTDGSWPYFAWRGAGLGALTQRLEPEQARRAGDAVISILENSTNDHRAFTVAEGGLTAMASRLEPAQVKRAAEALIGMLEESTNIYVASFGLQMLAPRLDSTQSTRAADVCIGIFEKSTNGRLLSVANIALGALVPRLTSAQVRRAAIALIASLEKSSDDLVLDEVSGGLEVLAPRLAPPEADRCWGVVIGMLEKSTDKRVLRRANGLLSALAPRLEAAQVKRAGNAFVVILENLSNDLVLGAAGIDLKALAPRLPPEQVRRVWDLLMAKPRQGNAWMGSPGNVLEELAPRLEQAQMERAVDALIGLLEKSKDTDALRVQSQGLTAVAPRLGPEQSKRAAAALIVMLEKSMEPIVQNAASRGLTAVAPQLGPQQSKRAAEALIAMLERSTAAEEAQNDPAWTALAALAPRLEPASRDVVSTRATAAVLDFCSSYDIESDLAMNGPSEAGNSIAVARSISSPRSLAKLLSHPACVADQRDVLLKRFEELALHDGKPAFLKPDATDGKKPAGDPPRPRRFHNLHDAAEWIQENWPDFDLETNCPVTWRGSR